MSDKDNFSNPRLLEIAVITFVAIIFLFLFVKILFD